MPTGEIVLKDNHYYYYYYHVAVTVLAIDIHTAYPYISGESSTGRNTISSRLYGQAYICSHLPLNHLCMAVQCCHRFVEKQGGNDDDDHSHFWYLSAVCIANCTAKASSCDNTTHVDGAATSTIPSVMEATCSIEA